MPTFSILIPTYNRVEKLKIVLDHLEQQKEILEGEVIVGIDGSQDGTEAYVKERQKTFPGTLRSFFIQNSGRAVIRNRLIDQAKGDVLLFIQDDIIVSENWLNEHLEFHKKKQGALVGFMTWYAKAPITPYMEWLEKGGHMLRFGDLQDGQKTDYWHFYMGNLSVPRGLLGDLRFDENFKEYGWEDIVLGYLFTKSGNSVYYSLSAKAFHWDEYKEENLREYMEKVGRSAVVVEQKYPGMNCVPHGLKLFIQKTVVAVGRIFLVLLPQRWKWYTCMKHSFLSAVKASRTELL